MCYILVDGIGNKSEDITLRRNMPPKCVMVVESTKRNINDIRLNAAG